MNLYECRIVFLKCEIIFSKSARFTIKELKICLPDRKIPKSKSVPSELTDLVSDLELFLSGKKNPLPIECLDLSSLTEFQKNILLTLRERVPRGSVITYGELAKFAKNPGACRAVGNVMSKNPFPLFFPCHRVIASGKQPGGFSGGLELKKRLLGCEIAHNELTKIFG